MTDFDILLAMLTKANEKFFVDEVEGEHPCILVESSSPFYDTGVNFSFNDDGSLWGVHSYEPEPEE